MTLHRIAALTLGLAASAAHAQASQGPLKLHVPSPDWREQII
jgi:hypothetical protein